MLSNIDVVFMCQLVFEAKLGRFGKTKKRLLNRKRKNTYVIHISTFQTLARLAVGFGLKGALPINRIHPNNWFSRFSM